LPIGHDSPGTLGNKERHDMKRRFALGTASVLAVVTGACSSGPHRAVGSPGHDTSTSITTLAGVSTTEPGSTQPVTSTTLFGSTTVKGTTLLRQVGEGNETTRLFRIPTGSAQWDLAWSYVCPGAVPKGGVYENFVLYVEKGSAIDVKDAAVTGIAGSDQGTEHYSDSGTLSLHVAAQEGCTWALSVILPSG
jgi:hypothetical protein